MANGRGGRRPGAGRKKKPLEDKIKSGEMSEAKILNFSSELAGGDMPKPEIYMTEQTKGATENTGAKVYSQMFEWLKERKCEIYVNPKLLEQYSMAITRWGQAERAINMYGMLAKHPTTGMPIASPYVRMANDYLKQSNILWMQIETIIKDNCTEYYAMMKESPNDDIMEKILSGRM